MVRQNGFSSFQTINIHTCSPSFSPSVRYFNNLEIYKYNNRYICYIIYLYYQEDDFHWIFLFQLISYMKWKNRISNTDFLKKCLLLNWKKKTSVDLLRSLFPVIKYGVIPSAISTLSCTWHIFSFNNNTWV